MCGDYLPTRHQPSKHAWGIRGIRGRKRTVKRESDLTLVVTPIHNLYAILPGSWRCQRGASQSGKREQGGGEHGWCI